LADLRPARGRSTSIESPTDSAASVSIKRPVSERLWTVAVVDGEPLTAASDRRNNLRRMRPRASGDDSILPESACRILAFPADELGLSGELVEIFL
jgi:hypothetical protein